MRNLVFLFTALILGTTSTMATVTAEDNVIESRSIRNNNSFIFAEDGITFSVYPDGEFDFYIDNRIGRHNKNITFNSGYDYSPYAQYDDYGAVIQVENIPIYYDYYGRVSQIGNVNINYRNNRVNRVGGMYVYYNNQGYYDYHTGYINTYNRTYVWRPFHALFTRPAIHFALVHTHPYRRWYSATRYTYYSPYKHNHRKTYAKIGKEHRYAKVRNERASVYRNDKRVAVRQNRTIRSNKTAVAKRTASTRSNKTIINRSNSSRNNNIASRSSNITKRSTSVRSPRSTVTQKTVTRTPQRTTVTRSTTIKRPQNSRATSTRTTSRTPARSTTYSSTRSSKSIASRTPSRNTSRTSGSRSSSTRSSRRN